MFAGDLSSYHQVPRRGTPQGPRLVLVFPTPWTNGVSLGGDTGPPPAAASFGPRRRRPRLYLGLVPTDMTRASDKDVTVVGAVSSGSRPTSVSPMSTPTAQHVMRVDMWIPCRTGMPLLVVAGIPLPVTDVAAPSPGQCQANSDESRELLHRE